MQISRIALDDNGNMFDFVLEYSSIIAWHSTVAA